MKLTGLLFLLAGCSNGPGMVQQTPTQTGPPLPIVPGGNPSSTVVMNQTPTSTVANVPSMVSFTLNGGVTGSYMIHATLPTSKLRHGHREFTIDVAHADMSIFIAFYGYQGPGTYILSEGINGGDVHIDLDQGLASWDLSLRTKAQCRLTITSDIPTMYVGIDRMKGAFSCPMLPSSSANHSLQPVAVSKGQIDVAIIVES